MSLKDKLEKNIFWFAAGIAISSFVAGIATDEYFVRCISNTKT